MNAKLLGTALVTMVVATFAAAPLEAQWRDPWGGAPFDAGYRDGARAGANDARSGRNFEYQRHRDYRAADSGYGPRFGNRDAYKSEYRNGFQSGYRDGYYSGGGRGGGQSRPNYGGGPGYGRPGYGGYPGARGGGYGRAPVVDIARSNGYEEGYRRGLDDGRDRDRPDLWRHRVYRNADRGYRDEYGPRGLYEQAFRDGFERGYDVGYRDGSRNRGRGVGGIFRW